MSEKITYTATYNVVGEDGLVLHSSSVSTDATREVRYAVIVADVHTSEILDVVWTKDHRNADRHADKLVDLWDIRYGASRVIDGVERELNAYVIRPNIASTFNVNNLTADQLEMVKNLLGSELNIFENKRWA